MRNTEFNLKAFREERLKMNQSHFAELLNIRQDTLSRYESQPGTIPLDIFIKISEVTGTSLNQLLNFKKVERHPLDVRDNWTSIRFLKESINRYIEESLDKINDTNNQNCLHNFQNTLSKFTGKPRIVLIGRSDSGKSTMINTLIGDDKLPRNWSPTTSITVYLKHIDDRPAYITDEVWVFKNDCNGQDWDDRRLNDEAYTTSLKIAQGDARLLHTYGTSEGEAYNKEEVSAAVLFIKSSLLKTCDIVDVPGFTGGRPSDVKAAENASKRADILIYLSQANAFMGLDDFTYLKGGIETLAVVETPDSPEIPKLANLFVVATQAHIIDNGNMEQLTKVLDRGAKRFYDTLTEDFWETKTAVSGQIYTEEDVRKRFFTYTTDIEHLRKPFENDLIALLEAFPNIVEKQIIGAIRAQQQVLRLELEERLERNRSFRSEFNSAKNEYQIRIEETPRIQFALEEKKKEILSEIEQSRLLSKEDFKNRFHALINETALIDLMRTKKTENKKQSKEQFLAYLSTKLDDDCKKALMREARRMQPKFEQYTDDCQKIFDSISVISTKKYNQVITSLNAKRVFASGISGAATFGALAVWASTLGNLGGYIIVAKAVSLLASLGIHVGGTAAGVGTVAAWGGPIAWGIGLAIIVGLVAFAVFGGSWKKQFAKGICKELKKAETLHEFITTIDQQWNDTEKAFLKGSDAVWEAWLKQNEEVEHIMNNYDASEIQCRIDDIELTIKILDNIPLNDN